MRVERMMRGLSAVLVVMALLPACQTKSELRRQQEMERLKQEVSASRADRADLEQITEELKGEVGRLNNALQEQLQRRDQQMNQQFENLQKEIQTLNARMQALEQRAVAQDLAAKQEAEKPKVATYDQGKRLFEDGKYDEAIDILKPLSRARPRTDETRKALYYLAESYYETKEYASAALSYAEYEKSYPKDALVPETIFKQGSCFKNMGKPKEAKLFYQEVLERYPKSKIASKARRELKHLR